MIPFKDIELTVDFITENADYIDWEELSRSRIVVNLKGVILNRFCDQLHWNIISRNPFITEEFIIRFKENINWYSLAMLNTGLSRGVKMKFEKEIEGVIGDMIYTI